MTRRLLPLLLATLAISVSAGGAAAETPTPSGGGGTWAQDQPITYRWATGEVPPSWLQSLVLAAAADANRSRESRAATFSYGSGGSSTVAYNTGPLCGAGALACMRRYPPSNFIVQFRLQGQRVSWGSIRWCHASTTWSSGCFDAELSGLHEFGHVEILGHSSTDTYPATVMTDVQAAYPQSGWNQHALGRCDVATLQKKYDVLAWTSPISTCLDLATVMTFTASATVVRSGATVTFDATLRTTANAAYERLADNPLHARTVVLQRASIGSTAWTDVGPMSPASAAGSYRRAVTVTGTYQWRAVFRPAGEGARAAASPAVAVRLQ